MAWLNPLFLNILHAMPDNTIHRRTGVSVLSVKDPNIQRMPLVLRSECTLHSGFAAPTIHEHRMRTIWQISIRKAMIENALLVFIGCKIVYVKYLKFNGSDNKASRVDTHIPVAFRK